MSTTTTTIPRDHEFQQLSDRALRASLKYHRLMVEDVTRQIVAEQVRLQNDEDLDTAALRALYARRDNFCERFIAAVNELRYRKEMMR